jgi:hypothetical protein
MDVRNPVSWRSSSNGRRNPMRELASAGTAGKIRWRSSMNKSPSVRAVGHAIWLAALAFAAASPGTAQTYPPPAPYPAPYEGVGPAEVLAQIQALHLRPLSEPVLRGPVWVTRAEGRDGTLVRVLVDAGSGRIVNIVAIDRPYPPRFAAGGPVREGPWVPMGGAGYDVPPGYGPPPAGYPAPTPEGIYPGAQSSRGPGPSPEKKLAARPSTPLPKPRPADAQDAKSDGTTVAADRKEPETTGSIPSGRKVESTDKPGKAETPPISPLE